MRGACSMVWHRGTHNYHPVNHHPVFCATEQALYPCYCNIEEAGENKQASHAYY